MSRTHSAIADGQEISRLVAGAFALRASARQNEDDERDAQISKVEFTYFVDPNTVIWFCRPQERQNLSGFDRPEPSSPTSEVGEDFPIAFATLEYIFSGQLPGSGRQPLYISESHVQEFQSAAEKVKMGRGRSGTKTAKEDFERAAQELRASESLPSDVDSLYDSIKSVLGNPVLAADFASRRYMDMYARKLVRAAHYDYWLPKGHPPWETLHARRQSRVDNWSERLLTFRTNRSETENLHRDAETLADLELLNETASLWGQKHRFVLVTTDTGIHLAMASWIGEGANRSAFCRHPRQYMPLLNLSSAQPHSRLEPEVFDRVKGAAEALAAAADTIVSDAPTGPRAQVFGLLGDGLIRAENWMVLADHAVRLKIEWRQAMRTAMTLLSDTLADTTLQPLNNAIRLLEDELQDAQLADLLEKVIEAQSVRMIQTNRAFAISGRLVAMARGRSRSTAPRMPNLLRVPDIQGIDRFIRLHGGDPNQLFEEFLGEVLAGDPDERIAVLNALENLLIELSDVEAYAFAAFVAFRLRDWKSVQSLTQAFEKAVQRLDRAHSLRPFAETYLLEAVYAKHVAERFLFTSPVDIRRLRDVMLRECTRGDLDPFIRARAASELAALTLVMILRARSGQFTVFEDNLRFLLSDAGRWIDHGLRWLDDRYSPVVDPRAANLRSQLLTNRAAFHLFRGDLFNEVEEVRGDTAAYAAFEKVRAEPGAHTMTVLYHHALGLMLSAQTDQTQLHARALRRALGEAVGLGTFGDPLDRLVFDWLHAVLNRFGR